MNDTLILLLTVGLVVFTFRNLLIRYIGHLNLKYLQVPACGGAFSYIDENNFFLYPSLLFTHPQYYHLTAGDAIYFPPKWWHWVESIGTNVAVAFSSQNSDPTYGDKPFITSHQQNVSLEDLMNETVSILDTNKYNVKQYSKTLQEFLNEKKIGHYVLSHTLNQLFRKKIGKQLTSINALPDYNIWISANDVSVGLHYDDAAVLLCVIKGEKKITVYPPSDSKKLHPIKMMS